MVRREVATPGFCPSTPTKKATLFTAGSLRRRSAICCWRFAMAEKDVCWGASATP